MSRIVAPFTLLGCAGAIHIGTRGNSAHGVDREPVQSLLSVDKTVHPGDSSNEVTVVLNECGQTCAENGYWSITDSVECQHTVEALNAAGGRRRRFRTDVGHYYWAGDHADHDLPYGCYEELGGIQNGDVLSADDHDDAHGAYERRDRKPAPHSDDHGHDDHDDGGTPAPTPHDDLGKGHTPEGKGHAHDDAIELANDGQCTVCKMHSCSLLMKVKAGSTTLQHGASYWTDSSVLNEEEGAAVSNHDDTDVKMSSFNTLPISALKVCCGSLQNCTIYDLHGTYSSAQALFSSGFQLGMHRMIYGAGESEVLSLNHQAWIFSGDSAGHAAAVGDPHLQNILGQRFDLMKAGKHVLISIPRGLSAEGALLRVQATASRLGGKCADMYFQELNVTGSWAEAKQAGGYHYSISQNDVTTPDWVAFGKVELKVVHGRTDNGLRYLNLYVKHLGQAGFGVGGLLGEDDHEDVTIPPEACAQRLSLLNSGDGDRRVPAWQSVALASLD